MMTNNQLRHDAASSEWQSADSIRAMADYLARSVSDAGAFAYKVSAKTGKSLSGYNILRHSGAIWALTSGCQIASDRVAATHAAQRAASYLRSFIVRCPQNPAATMAS